MAAQDDTSKREKGDTRQAGKNGFVRIEIEVPLDSKAVLENAAKTTGLSLPHLAGILLTKRVKLYEEQVEQIEKRVSEVFDEKYKQFEEEIASLLQPVEQSNRLIEKILFSSSDKDRKTEIN